MAEQAARLCKADLVTEMVGEFPELQGLMGGYYARAEGLPDAVAHAIRDHYKPVGQGDDVPTAPVTVAVALADKLDTLAGFFYINEKPTGSKDPYALRRAALAIARLIVDNNLRVPQSALIERIQCRAEVYAELPKLFHDPDQLRQTINLVEAATDVWLCWASPWNWQLWLDGKLFDGSAFPQKAHDNPGEAKSRVSEITVAEVVTFLADRLKVQQREAGVRHDLIDAVFALGEDDLVRLLARVHALQSFMATEDGANLHAGYKRAANILRKEGFNAPDQAQDDQGIAQTGEEDPLALVDDPILGDAVAEWARPAGGPLEPAEAALAQALDAAERRAAAAVEAEDFEGAMAALASLRAPIDRFFDEVTVNAGDPDVRTRRLGLLARFRDAVHRVADFSKIEG